MIESVHVSLAGIHNQVSESLLVAFARWVAQAMIILKGSKKTPVLVTTWIPMREVIKSE